MVAALRCVRPQCQWYQLAYATGMKSIQLHDSIEGLSQKIVSITLHYITLQTLLNIIVREITWGNIHGFQMVKTPLHACGGG